MIAVSRVLTLAAAAGLVAAAADPPPAAEPAPARTVEKPAGGRITLLGMLADWTYPGAERVGEATMSDGGVPRPSVRCQAVLTTPDSVERVTVYFVKRFGGDAAGDADGDGAGPAAAGDTSVSLLDDSHGRPVDVRVVTVTSSDATTTLVVSRAAGETLTHVAWSHHRRFGVQE